MSDNTMASQMAGAGGRSLADEPLPHFAEPVRAPHGTTPLRRAGSVRRTMSIDVHWPDGFLAPGQYLGRCRDAVTPPAADPSAPLAPDILAEAEVSAVLLNRQIMAISANPASARLQDLVGARAGGHLRQAVAEALPEDKAAGTPLHLLLDDLAGASFVSNWAYTRWHDDWEERYAEMPQRPMQGVCIGFRPGAASLDAKGYAIPGNNVSRVVALTNPLDPHGWHGLPEQPGMSFRRARWIDVWRDGAELAVEALFQDSAERAGRGDRFAIHEYRLEARVGSDGCLRVLEAFPGTLPYASCRAAPVNNAALLGVPVRQLREIVLERLKHAAGCTHLNDAIRALAEVEVLAGALPAGS